MTSHDLDTHRIFRETAVLMNDGPTTDVCATTVALLTKLSRAKKRRKMIKI